MRSTVIDTNTRMMGACVNLAEVAEHAHAVQGEIPDTQTDMASPGMAETEMATEMATGTETVLALLETATVREPETTAVQDRVPGTVQDQAPVTVQDQALATVQDQAPVTVQDQELETDQDQVGDQGMVSRIDQTAPEAPLVRDRILGTDPIDLADRFATVVMSFGCNGSHANTKERLVASSETVIVSEHRVRHAVSEVSECHVRFSPKRVS